LIKIVLLTTLFIVCGLVAAVALVFGSKDHGAYDLPTHPLTGTRTSESPEHAAAAKLIATEMNEAPKLGRAEMLQLMRQQLDSRGESIEIGAEIRPVNVAGISAEWVVAPNANPERRLLYFHGGGYVMGSPKSHRLITSRLSAVSGAVVLAIDYRLQPENSRMAGIEDCRTAYRWIVENGPETESSVHTLFVAGDSSGGNLALATIAWARDNRLRAADAVVVFSPQTDATLASPSLVENIGSDVMQGSSFGPVVKAPKVLSLAVSFLMNRINPSNPIVSPLLGDLSNLPPTLVQASETEMFLDDAVRYVNKATAQGSPAQLQTWPFVMHAWHAFQVPEAEEAFQQAGAFLLEQKPI